MSPHHAIRLHWASYRPPEGKPPPAARTPPGTVVYAIGDIHGCSDLLACIQRGIALDIRMRPATRRVVVYLGDYISRGPDTRRVLDQVIAWHPDGIEIVTLMGNHEQLLLRYLDGDLKAGGHWLAYGGLEAAAHYGIDTTHHSPSDPATLPRLKHQLAAALPDAHTRLLRSLALNHREGDYLFVHAGIAPGIALPAQSERDQVWIRQRFLQSPLDHGAVVVHGHCIAPEPQVRHNRIGIDTGAYQSGVLTCLVLDGAERAFLQTGPPANAPPDD
ncbi:MAG: serine/threonine protein phosphatase [Rhodocyclales bacterium]|nr:serine/threonine protein phosphatase [Rhodocyclales bacterium]